jgi:hypothetical protein
MDVLYYSNNCKYCQKLLAHLAKLGLLEKYNFVCIDRRSVDPNTKQITITLDRGLKTTLPPNVSRVPTLLLINQKYTAVVGDDIYNYVDSKISPDPNNPATENGGEPIGYILAPSSGGVNIVSETYTMYNAPPEELSAKGNGGTRQMYNYASAKNEFNDIAISTPFDDSNRLSNANLPTNSSTYNAYSVPGVLYNTGQVVVPELQRPPVHRHNKLGEETTVDSLQQKRNSELQNSLPFIAKQLNNIISPEISNVQPPMRDLSADDSRGILYGNRSGASSSSKQYTSEMGGYI